MTRNCTLALLVISAFLLVRWSSFGVQGKKTLSFQLQISQGEQFDFFDFIPAVDLALELINANDSILPNFTLQYTPVVDPQCEPTKSVNGFIRHVTMELTNETEIMVIGGVCSIATQPVASLANLWNMVQISPSSSSPRLSDQSLFPGFLRLVPGDDKVSHGVVELMKKLQWKYIAILTQEADIFTLTRDAIEQHVENVGFKVVHFETFTDQTSPEKAVSSLKESSGRIIFLNTYPEYAKEILCQALSLGMTAPDYAWITFGWFPDGFWKSSYANRTNYEPINHCSPSDLAKIVQNMLFIDQYPRLDESDVERGNIIGCQDEDNFLELFRQKREEVLLAKNETHTDQEKDVPFAYDSTWLAALALHKAEEELQDQDPPRSLSSFNHTSDDIRRIIYDHALATTFQGASGNVWLLESGDRSVQHTFHQICSSTRNKELSRMYVGRLDNYGQLEISSECQLFGDNPPKSHNHQTIHKALFIPYVLLAVAGMGLAVVCIVFNVVFRKKPIVKLSSPLLNILFLLGTIMMYLVVVLLGLDDSLLPVGVVSIFCQVNVWILVVAFTLIYGVILAKTFKVFYIFKNLQVAKPVSNRKKTIQDWHLFAMVGGALAIDVIFLLIVTVLDKARLELELQSITVRNGEIPSQLHTCSSSTKYIWTSVLTLYKTVEVVLILIFAFEVRKIKVKELSDLRTLVLSVYSIVVTGLALTVQFHIENQSATLRYGVAGFICLVFATVIITVNFFPKMCSLYRDPSGKEKLDFSEYTSSVLKSTSKGGKREPSQVAMNSSIPAKQQPSILHLPLPVAENGLVVEEAVGLSPDSKQASTERTNSN